MATVLPNQQKFAQCLASKTGLNVYVIYAWIALETGLFTIIGNGKYFNYLNIRGSGDAGSYNGWAKYSSPEAACTATYHLLLTGASWTGYAAILASAGKSTQTQYMAIVNSAWCAPRGKCYGGGTKFANVLRNLPGAMALPDTSAPSTFEQAASDPAGSFATGAGIIGGSLLKFAAGAGKRIVFVLGGMSAAAFGLYFIAKETGVGAGIADKAKTAAKGVAIL
jgi:hypothetical protein